MLVLIHLMYIFLVQFLVLLVELPEFGVGLHQRVDFILRLPFEHDDLLHAETRTPRPCGTGRCWVGKPEPRTTKPTPTFQATRRKLFVAGSRRCCIGPVLRCPGGDVATRTIDPTPEKRFRQGAKSGIESVHDPLRIQPAQVPGRRGRHLARNASMPPKPRITGR